MQNFDNGWTSPNRSTMISIAKFEKSLKQMKTSNSSAICSAQRCSGECAHNNNVAIANALQLEAARATRALPALTTTPCQL